LIRAEFDPVALAKDLAAAGAASISVLTEEEFFQGDFEAHAGRARSGIQFARAAKDFIV